MRENTRRYYIKQLRNTISSVVYADQLVIIRVVICYTGSGGLRQRVADMEVYCEHLLAEEVGYNDRVFALSPYLGFL
jgi:hypothetical protein